MSRGWVGALLGALLAVGALVAARAAPPLRPVRLTERIGPYLGDAPAPSRLLTGGRTTARFGAAGALLGPVLADLTRAIDRVIGGSRSVRRRLGGLGSTTSVEEFRIEQVIYGAIGVIGGSLLFATLTATRGGFNVLATLAAAVLGGLAGVLGRDWWLTQQVQRRQRIMLAEFPVVADLLALAVLAGEAPIDAVQRVCSRSRGELTRDLSTALSQARSGTPMTQALTALGERTTLEALTRFVEGLVVAIERGTPLADVLRAQATDVREQSKRALLEAGGRKELQMMVPVVFLILPTTVLFALYPGLVTVVSLSS